MITLNEATHEYTVDGKVLPSVSEIMRPLSEAYYRDVLKFNDLSEASDYGSGVHKAVQQYINFGIISDKYIKEVMAFIGWLDEEKLVVIYNEWMLTNGEYCGTIDLLMRHIPTGNIYLVDMKATTVIAEPLLEVQLCGYEGLTSYNGVRIDGTYVLHLKKNGNYAYRPVAINRWKWKNLYEKHKNESISNRAER